MITIGVISGELLRYSQFTQTLTTMDVPEGGATITWAASCALVSNLNAVTEQALSDGSTHLLVMGDDHVIPRDLLTRLVAHDVPIVAPLCVMRQPPYRATIFMRKAGQGYDFRQLTGGRQGLVEVEACGNAGMLIHRDVLVKMPEPWWEAGKIDPAKLMEDVYFCQKARALGFSIYVDTTLGLGHLTTVTLWPSWKESGELGAKLAINGAYVYDAPAVTFTA